MTKTQVEVITSVQRGRRWSRSEKERIVTAAMESGAVASEVARAAGIHTSQLFRWRQQLCEREQLRSLRSRSNCSEKTLKLLVDLAGPVAPSSGLSGIDAPPPLHPCIKL